MHTFPSIESLQRTLLQDEPRKHGHIISFDKFLVLRRPINASFGKVTQYLTGRTRYCITVDGVLSFGDSVVQAMERLEGLLFLGCKTGRLRRSLRGCVEMLPELKDDPNILQRALSTIPAVGLFSGSVSVAASTDSELN